MNMNRQEGTDEPRTPWKKVIALWKAEQEKQMKTKREIQGFVRINFLDGKDRSCEIWGKMLRNRGNLLPFCLCMMLYWPWEKTQRTQEEPAPCEAGLSGLPGDSTHTAAATTIPLVLFYSGRPACCTTTTTTNDCGWRKTQKQQLENRQSETGCDWRHSNCCNMKIPRTQDKETENVCVLWVQTCVVHLLFVPQRHSPESQVINTL